MADHSASFDVRDDCDDLQDSRVVHEPADPNPEQAALVSVMTGALTGAFGLFLGKKE